MDVYAARWITASVTAFALHRVVYAPPGDILVIIEASVPLDRQEMENGAGRDSGKKLVRQRDGDATSY